MIRRGLLNCSNRQRIRGRHRQHGIGSSLSRLGDHRHQSDDECSSPMTRRHIASSSAGAAPTVAEQVSSYLPNTPEFVANASFWGATGILLTNFHTHLHLPYWSCICLTNVCIRSAMLPVVINGAKTQVRFGKISPEIQFILSTFQREFRDLRQRSSSSVVGSMMQQMLREGERRAITTNLQTLRGLFKLNQVNLLDMFKSPMLQIPFFWYFAIDLRKIINGSDPELAQQLVESSFFWITDLTEPDPWYGLPIATGLLLYANVEVSVGRRALSGETSSKSNVVKLLKDGFQSLAIFMPAFMAAQPSGVQLYLGTSMLFTLVQSSLLRNDVVRKAVGLPSVNAKPVAMQDGEYVKEFMKLSQERQEAKAKSGFVLGEGVTQFGAAISMPRQGSRRKSSIIVESPKESTGSSTSIEIELPSYMLQSPLLVVPEIFQTSTPVPYQRGKVAPQYAVAKADEQLEMPEVTDVSMAEMEAANRGEKLQRVVMAPEAAQSPAQDADKAPINLTKKFKRKGKAGKRNR